MPVAVAVKLAVPPAQTAWFAGWPVIDGGAHTVNGLLVPVSVPPVRVAVIVRLVPLPVNVTLSVRWPLVKEPETLGLIVPAVVLRLTVLVKLVTVLVNWS